MRRSTAEALESRAKTSSWIRPSSLSAATESAAMIISLSISALLPRATSSEGNAGLSEAVATGAAASTVREGSVLAGGVKIGGRVSSSCGFGNLNPRARNEWYNCTKGPSPWVFCRGRNSSPHAWMSSNSLRRVSAARAS
jgi:hypothetical protein